MAVAEPEAVADGVPRTAIASANGTAIDLFSLPLPNPDLSVQP
jgi:hypothetical protein